MLESLGVKCGHWESLGAPVTNSQPGAMAEAPLQGEFENET